jgi:hypothetical protein
MLLIMRYPQRHEDCQSLLDQFHLLVPNVSSIVGLVLP